MYPEALAYLRCPEHPDQPLILAPGAQAAADGAILSGQLRCQSSGTMYPIDLAIADLLGSGYAPDSIAQLTNYLPPTAWAYERLWRKRALSLFTGEAFGYDRELPLLVELAAPEHGGLYVDVACSNGLYARALAAKLSADQGHVIGIDHSLPMLRQAHTFAHKEQLRISFVRAKAQALPFANQTVAGVVMGGSLNEIGDADRCLSELQRVLVPGGRCVLMNLVQAEHTPGRVVQRLLRPGGITFWSLAELNRRLQATGLRLAHQEQHQIVVFSLLVRD